MTNVMKLTGAVLFVIILLVICQCIRIQDNKISMTETKQYDKVKAIVNSVYASGRNYKRSTLINVSYTYDNRQRRANLRREGYKEGVFNKGDTITIFVNRSNPDEIK